MEEQTQELQSATEIEKEAVDDTVVIDLANASTFHAGKFEGWERAFAGGRTESAIQIR